MTKPRQVAGSDYTQRTHTRSAGGGVPISRMMTLGHSQVYASRTSAAVWRPKDIMYWLCLESGGVLDHFYADNFGYSGETTTDILTHQAAWELGAGDAALVLPDTNDFKATVQPDTFANDVAMWSTLKSKGKRVVHLVPFPRNDDGFTQDHIDRLKAHRLALLASAESHGIFLVDATDDLVDPATIETTFAPLSGLLYDDLHLTPKASLLVSRRVRARMGNRLPTVAAPDFENTKTYNATTNPTGNLLNNPRLLTAGGSFSAGGSTQGAVMQVPANWTLVGANATGLTISCEMLSGGGVEISVTGTPTSTNPSLSLRQNITAGDFTSGDVLDLGLWVEASEGMANVLDMPLTMRMNFGAGDVDYAAGGGLSGEGAMPDIAWAGLAMVRETPVSGTVTSGSVRQYLNFAQNQPVSMELRIMSASLNKAA